jgi:phospholipase/carboxylesterase
MSRRSFMKTGLSALAGPMVAACDNSTTEPESSPERLTARPGEPTITPTTGLSSLSLGSDPLGFRDGLLYVPESYSPNTPAPLFIGLHGAGGDADNWQSYPARAEARGMVFLAPDSRSFSTWDAIMGAFGPDVEFIDRALRHTFERCRIDPARIALGGFSDGASYAISLGIRNGDLFSHLVAYSPGFYIATDSPVGKPPVFVSHGTGDDVLPVATSRDYIVPTLRSDGYDVVYHEFEGGHEVPADISDSALDWFAGAAAVPWLESRA